MIKFFNRMLVLLAGVLFCVSLNAKVVAFNSGTMKMLESAHLGQSWLLVVWSTDCPPCHAELAMLSRLQDQDAKLDIEFVATDPISNRDVVLRTLDDKGLSTRESWVYDESNSAKLQYSIDPQWRGEQPRSYFYQANGERCSVSGILNESMIEYWFGENRISCEALLSKR